MKRICFIIFLFALLSLLSIGFVSKHTTPNLNIEEKYSEILSYEVNLKKSNLQFYSTDEAGNYFKNNKNLKDWLGQKKLKLVFAMNGGMYNKDLSPQGLYIENGIQKMPINKKRDGYGNFYMNPNGIFLITKDDEPIVITTENFMKLPVRYYNEVKHATQSGPMLLIDGKEHIKFNKASKNVHIRNGVGILPNGNALFAMSKEEVTFYRLAQFFKNAGCENALYLDGFVSRTYLPKKDWVQVDGVYGIIIAEAE